MGDDGVEASLGLSLDPVTRRVGGVVGCRERSNGERGRGRPVVGILPTYRLVVVVNGRSVVEPA